MRCLPSAGGGAAAGGGGEGESTGDGVVAWAAGEADTDAEIVDVTAGGGVAAETEEVGAAETEGTEGDESADGADVAEAAGATGGGSGGGGGGRGGDDLAAEVLTDIFGSDLTSASCFDSIFGFGSLFTSALISWTGGGWKIPKARSKRASATSTSDSDILG